MSDFDNYINNLIDTDPVMLGTIARGLEADGRATREALEELREFVRKSAQDLDMVITGITGGMPANENAEELRSIRDHLLNESTQ